MRVPPHLREVANTLALRTWVHRREFPREAHFKSIDLFKERLEAHHNTDEEGLSVDEALAAMIAAALEVEGALLTYVVEQDNYSLQAQDAWPKACLAAGWVVLQRYELECSNRKWSPGESQSA